MDHSFPPETLPLSADLAAVAARVAGFIGSGGRAVVLLGTPGAGKTVVMETVLASLPGRQMRISNPGVARHGAGPLTMKRILRQMGAPSDALTSGQFFRTLAEQAYDDESAAVAVDDAHTLSPYALSALARIPGLGGPELPGMILFLVGEAALLGKLAAPGLELLRNSRRALVLTLPHVLAARGASENASAARLMWTTLAPELQAAPARTLVPRPAPDKAAAESELLIISRTGPKAWQPVLAGAVVVVAVVMSTLWPSRVGDAPRALMAPASVVPAVLRSAAPVPDPPVPAPPPPSVPEAAPGTRPDTPPAVEAGAPSQAPKPADLSDAQLRREFDVFLDRAGRDTAKLTPSARESLFQEYLLWRARSITATP